MSIHVDYSKLAQGPCGNIEEAVEAFLYEGQVQDCMRYGSGHINDTFLLTCRKEGAPRQYILQRMNTNVFKDPEGLMKNISGVTTYLRQQILAAEGDPDRETLTLVKTRTGCCYYTDSMGSWWRMYLFITGASTYDTVEKEEDFYESARAFGQFQRLLSGYPVMELTETISGFHDTPARLETLKQAVRLNKMGRAALVAEEIQFVMDRAGDIPILMNALAAGQIPRRVTHNDTKLNNIMLDDVTGKAVCVIDLDTIMPGSSLFDYGDSIRFGANTGAEDETDLSRVALSLPLFRAFTKGFLEGCGKSLTDMELALLPMGAKLMTLECGIRFLTDYLEGDTYFKIHRKHHNLDRARCQFALVADMERKWSQMEQAVREAAISPAPTKRGPLSFQDTP